MTDKNPIEIKLKTVGGESITEAVISKIFKKIGDFVELDEPIVELETDKVNMEIGSDASGVIQNIFYKEGDVVKVGDLLATLIPGEKTQTKKNKESAQEDKIVQENKIEQPISNKKEETTMAHGSSPSALRAANENPHNFAIAGSARGGNIITKLDIVNNLNQTSQPLTAMVSTPEEKKYKVKMSPLRRTIARRLKEAQNNAALLTTFNEVDMSAVIELRKKYQDDFQKKYGVKLGFMSIFARASMLALREIPAVNAEIEGDNIIYKNYYNIGVAIGSEKGLVVPVIRDIDKLGLHEIEKSIADYAGKANKNNLTANDFADGTFTISNGGVYGSLMSTPIVNPPQSAILGMHSIVQRPVVVDGVITIRPMMYLALTYDHRIVDGKEAVTFLVKIKNYIESPQRMLLFV